jgi:hypothetical protein
VPEQLWREAAEIARIEGINPTARALRFNYYALKRWVDESADTVATQSEPSFVELQMAEVTPAPSEAKVIVELVDDQARRMRIELGDPHGVDLVGLASALFGGQPCSN